MTDIITYCDINTCEDCPRYGDDCDGDKRVEHTDLISRADAEPTVIRSKTLLPTKDFKEWAKRIREVNPNAVVIPCDAEVASADAVQGEWVCKEREYNDCDGYYAHYWYECSVCGARPPKDQWKNEWHSDFCPNCGARMKGGAE